MDLVTAIFRDESALQAALGELVDAGLEQAQFNVQREQDAGDDDSPGNDQTLIAQNQAGFALLGGFLFLAGGALLAYLAGWLTLDNPFTLLIPLGLGLLGRLLGGWIGGFFRFGYRTIEARRDDGDKVVLRVEPRSPEQHRLAVKILKRNGAAGAGTPLH